VAGRRARRDARLRQVHRLTRAPASGICKGVQEARGAGAGLAHLSESAASAASTSSTAGSSRRSRALAFFAAFFARRASAAASSSMGSGGAVGAAGSAGSGAAAADGTTAGIDAFFFFFCYKSANAHTEPDRARGRTFFDLDERAGVAAPSSSSSLSSGPS
jgi:hypothetical protein